MMRDRLMAALDLLVDWTAPFSWDVSPDTLAAAAAAAAVQGSYYNLTLEW